MLDRLEATVRRAEGEIEGDLAHEAEVAATMAIVDHLRDILISQGRPQTTGKISLVRFVVTVTWREILYLASKLGCT